MFNRPIARAKILVAQVKNQLTRLRKKSTQFVERRPFASFFVALGTLVLLIVLSNVFGTPKVQTTTAPKQTKVVHTYRIGQAPRLTVQAQIEKSGVLRITALTAGVVQRINLREGQQFGKGDTLIGLSTNYQGGNTFSLQRSLAQTQYSNAVNTFQLQKDIIQKQRETAEKADVNADELRAITDKSLSETRDLVSLNENIVRTLDENLNELESTNTNGSNDALILSTKQLKSQFMAATGAARQGLRSAEFQAASDRAPAQLSDLQKDIAIKQLDLQERMLEMNREISRIQLQIAQVTEAMMFPSAPFAGVVQRVLVKEGQAVNPGTELMMIAQEYKDDPTLAIAYVPQAIASKISYIEPSILTLNSGEALELYPSYITQDAVRSTLHAAYFNIPEGFIPKVTEGGFIEVQIPIGYFDSASAVPYVPIDAVYQTKDKNYLYVIDGKNAVSREVTLGAVFGSYVEVASGLAGGDTVIVDRNVIAGDAVRVAN